jgi:hypothetical protein
MMHTFLKHSDTRYDVGQWLTNREGWSEFNTMFTVVTLSRAFAAVNALNGGESLDPEILKLEVRR